jgi:hypothetical protein
MSKGESESELPTVEQELRVIQAGEKLLRRAHVIARHINAKVKNALSGERQSSLSNPPTNGTRSDPSSSN